MLGCFYEKSPGYLIGSKIKNYQVRMESCKYCLPLVDTHRESPGALFIGSITLLNTSTGVRKAYRCDLRSAR